MHLNKVEEDYYNSVCNEDKDGTISQLEEELKKKVTLLSALERKIESLKDSNNICRTPFKAPMLAKRAVLNKAAHLRGINLSTEVDDIFSDNETSFTDNLRVDPDWRLTSEIRKANKRSANSKENEADNDSTNDDGAPQKKLARSDSGGCRCKESEISCKNCKCVKSNIMCGSFCKCGGVCKNPTVLKDEDNSVNVIPSNILQVAIEDQKLF